MELLLSINWNPSGVIFTLGSYELRWYSLLFAAGFVVSFYILKKRFAAANVKHEKLEKLTLYIFVATVIGARLGHCLFYDWAYYSQNLLEIFLPVQFEPEFQFIGFRGLASHGGAIGIFIALLIFSKKEKVNLWWILDQMALVIPLAGAFIRTGNLMNSEIIGHPSDLPWAFVFQQLDDIPRHPGQLYEALAYVLIFLLLKFVIKKWNKQKGFIFGLFLTLMFGARLILEMFKENQKGFEDEMMLNMGQLLSIPFILFGLYLIFTRNKNAEA